MDLSEPVFQTTFAAIGYNPFFSLNQYSKAQNYAENHLCQRQRHPLRLQKGFYEYIAASGADIVCVQELKAQEADLSDEMKNPHGMHGHWHCAEKRGYSGVAVYSKRAPDNVQIGMGIEEFDREGRFVRCDFGKLSVISLYLPSGTSAPERQELKYRF